MWHSQVPGACLLTVEPGEEAEGRHLEQDGVANEDQDAKPHCAQNTPQGMQLYIHTSTSDLHYTVAPLSRSSAHALRECWCCGVRAALIVLCSVGGAYWIGDFALPMS